MRRNGKRTKEDYWVDGINYFLVGLIALVTLYPFYFVLISSFNDGLDTAKGGVYLWPREFTLDNYLYFFNESKWMIALGVTSLRTVIGTILGVLFTSLVAYGLSRDDLIFRKFYFIIVVIAMNVSGGLVAYYVVLNGLGLINSFGVYVIPTMLSLFFLLIAVSFFREIPAELGESARMDGASELKIFRSIILPISLPLLATMSLFTGATQWNSWVDASYFVQSDHLRTVSYRMLEVINQTMLPTDSQAASYTAQLQVTQFSVQMTALVISVFPIMCVYPFLQKYFVQGMMLGSVKG